MATDKDAPEKTSETKPSAAGASGAKASANRPVTIDLPAEKVAAKTQDKGTKTTSVPSSKKPASAKEAEKKPAVMPSDDKTGVAPSDKTISASKPSESVNTQKTAEEKKAATVDKPSDTPKPVASQEQEKGDKKAGGFLSLLAAGLLGGVVTFGGIYGAHVAGMLPVSQPDQAGVSQKVVQLEEKLAMVESSLATVKKETLNQIDGVLSSSQQKMTSVQEKTTLRLDDLEHNLSDLQAGFDNLSSSTAEPQVGSPVSSDLPDLDVLMTRVNTVGSDLDALGEEAQVLTDKLQDVATVQKALSDTQATTNETLASVSSGLNALSETQKGAVSALNGQIAALTGRLDTVEDTMGDATARELAARALSVSALKVAVDSGKPFAIELSAVKAGLPAEADISGLEKYAAAGVASRARLIADFPGVARHIFATFSSPERSGNMLDDLLSGAQSLIAVRGPADVNGSAPADVLNRMETAVSSGDLATAVNEFSALPETARAAGAVWAEQAKARIDLDRLTAETAHDVLSALGKKEQ